MNGAQQGVTFLLEASDKNQHAVAKIATLCVMLMARP
jgi:hypothetical protein